MTDYALWFLHVSVPLGAVAVCVYAHWYRRKQQRARGRVVSDAG